LARHEPDIRASGEKQITLSDLLSLIGPNEDSDRERKQAIALYLSAGDGWAEVVRKLGGAFADEATLKDRKTDRAGH
jgi:hypothetical protein